MNHIIFIAHTLIISCCTLLFGHLGSAALTSYISILFVFTNIFVIKQIELCSYSVTSADAYIIGVSFGINLLQEIWGKKTAQLAIVTSFACSFFYLIMGHFQILYIPAKFDTSQIHFLYLMEQSIRIIMSSFVSYLTVQYIDTISYAYLKKRTDGKYFIIRNYLSMLSSQFFDTIIFSFLGLYGIVHNIWHVIYISYIIKVAAILLTTPAIYYAKKIVKK